MASIWYDGRVIVVVHLEIHERQMPVLDREKCVACRGDSPILTDEEIARLRPSLPQWSLITEDGMRQLHRTVKFTSFKGAIEFANRIADVAEHEGHHPRLVVEWGSVGVAWWTHKINGLHRNDFIMAAKTDLLIDS